MCVEIILYSFFFFYYYFIVTHAYRLLLSRYDTDKRFDQYVFHDTITLTTVHVCVFFFFVFERTRRVNVLNTFFRLENPRLLSDSSKNIFRPPADSSSRHSPPRPLSSSSSRRRDSSSRRSGSFSPYSPVLDTRSSSPPPCARVR